MLAHEFLRHATLELARRELGQPLHLPGEGLGPGREEAVDLLHPAVDGPWSVAVPVERGRPVDRIAHGLSIPGALQASEGRFDGPERRQIGSRRQIGEHPQVGRPKRGIDEPTAARWPDFRLPERAHLAGIGVREGLRPEVEERLLGERTRVVLELELEVGSTLERRIGQHAVAEAVNGRNRRFVDLRERELETLVVATKVGAAARQGPQLGIVYRIALLIDPSRERPHRVSQARANAAPELRRRRLGEGHDEDLVCAEAALDDETDEERGDGVRLARSRARLHEQVALQGRGDRRPRVHAEPSSRWS